MIAAYRPARFRAIQAAAILIALACASSPACAQGASQRGTWLFDAGASVGDLTAGGVLAGRFRLPSGLALGLEIDPVSDYSVDPVLGLSGGYTLYLSAYMSAGWDFALGRHFSLGGSLLLGAEASFLSEHVVDPAHGIDQKYSTTDFMFDPACRVSFAWFPLDRIGLSLTALVSLYDLRKSLASLCISLRSGE